MENRPGQINANLSLIESQNQKKRFTANKIIFLFYFLQFDNTLDECVG